MKVKGHEGRVGLNQTDHHIRRLYDAQDRHASELKLKYALIPCIFRLSLVFGHALYSTGLDTTSKEP